MVCFFDNSFRGKQIDAGTLFTTAGTRGVQREAEMKTALFIPRRFTLSLRRVFSSEPASGCKFIKIIFPGAMSIATYLIAHDAIRHVIAARRPELRSCDIAWGISLEIISWSYVVVTLGLISCVGRRNRWVRWGVPELVSLIALALWVQPGVPPHPNRAALVCFSVFLGLAVHYIARRGWRNDDRKGAKK